MSLAIGVRQIEPVYLLQGESCRYLFEFGFRILPLHRQKNSCLSGQMTAQGQHVCNGCKCP